MTSQYNNRNICEPLERPWVAEREERRLGKRGATLGRGATSRWWGEGIGPAGNMGGVRDYDAIINPGDHFATEFNSTETDLWWIQTPAVKSNPFKHVDKQVIQLTNNGSTF